ncbi:hypothetical protein TWF506_002511 [Arthrobotrys conoides]|uniref:Peptidase A1 domain-containing protein n=1 Tax=Arthrobotrys conoides TaxID=74498 RepID=A0AAN8N975_9PEZI
MWSKNSMGYTTISVFWVLLWAVPGPLWTGSITPEVRTIRNENIEVRVPVPNYTEGSNPWWGTECGPATACDVLLGKSLDQGTFSYVVWKTKTGLLTNAILQASSRNSSAPKHQKLDNTGYSYLGRSYGVAASVGLVDLQAFNNGTGGNPVAMELVRSYSYFEDGYLSAVSCQTNFSSQLFFSKLGEVQSINGRFPVQIYRAGGSLPNGEWVGFPTAGILTNEYVSALAAVIGEDRYMYGFLAGDGYKQLNRVQCEVTFTPTRFNVSVDVDAKEVVVTPLPQQDYPAVDIDDSRALVNISFNGVSYLSQTCTTLYTSVLADAFKRNIQNVYESNQRDRPLPNDNIKGITQGVELLLDSFLGSIGAAQLIVASDIKVVSGNVTAVDAVQIGNTSVAVGLMGFVLVVFVVIFLEVGFLWCKFSRRLFSDRDFLDYKSAIVGVAKGAGYEEEAIVDWNGDEDDEKVGNIKVTAVGDDDTGLKLGDKLPLDSNLSSESLVVTVEGA